MILLIALACTRATPAELALLPSLDALDAAVAAVELDPASWRVAVEGLRGRVDAGDQASLRALLDDLATLEAAELGCDDARLGAVVRDDLRTARALLPRRPVDEPLRAEGCSHSPRVVDLRTPLDPTARLVFRGYRLHTPDREGNPATLAVVGDDGVPRALPRELLEAKGPWEISVAAGEVPGLLDPTSGIRQVALTWGGEVRDSLPVWASEADIPGEEQAVEAGMLRCTTWTVTRGDPVFLSRPDATVGAEARLVGEAVQVRMQAELRGRGLDDTVATCATDWTLAYTSPLADQAVTALRGPSTFTTTLEGTDPVAATPLPVAADPTAVQPTGEESVPEEEKPPQPAGPGEEVDRTRDELSVADVPAGSLVKQVRVRAVGPEGGPVTEVGWVELDLHPITVQVTRFR